MKENILHIISIFDAKITDSSFNEKAIYLDFENDHAWATISYDPTTLNIIGATVESKDYEHYYRLKGSDNAFEYDDEAIELEVLEDYLEKGLAIWNDQPFDPRIIVELQVDEDVREMIDRACEIKNVSVDDFMNEVLTNVIKEHEENGNLPNNG